MKFLTVDEKTATNFRKLNFFYHTHIYAISIVVLATMHIVCLPSQTYFRQINVFVLNLCIFAYIFVKLHYFCYMLIPYLTTLQGIVHTHIR